MVTTYRSFILLSSHINLLTSMLNNCSAVPENLCALVHAMCDKLDRRLNRRNACHYSISEESTNKKHCNILHFIILIKMTTLRKFEPQTKRFQVAQEIARAFQQTQHF